MPRTEVAYVEIDEAPDNQECPDNEVQILRGRRVDNPRVNTQSNQSILLDIYERLGGIEVQLRDIKKLDARIEKLDERTVVLERFENRIGAYIWLGGSIVSGVLFFLFEGLKYLVSSKDGISRLFH